MSSSMFWEICMFLLLGASLYFLLKDVSKNERVMVELSRFLLVTASIIAVVAYLSYSTNEVIGWIGAVVALYCGCGAMAAAECYQQEQRNISWTMRILSCGSAACPGALLVWLAVANIGHGFCKAFQIAVIVITVVALIGFQTFAVFTTDREWVTGTRWR